MLNGKQASLVDMLSMRSAWRDLAIRWELSWEERRALLPSGGEDDSSTPKDTETRMRMLIEVGHRVRLEGGEDLCDWLRRPVEVLGWYSPLEVMSGAIGDLRRFRGLVEAGFGA